MLSDEKRKLFFQLLKECSKDEWIWMTGYISAMVQPLDGPIPLTSITNDDVSERIVTSSVSTTVLESKVQSTLQVTVLYGTETGNAKKLATSFVKKLKDAGHIVKLKSTETYKPTELDTEKNLIVVVSTHGDGDPPAAAKQFVETLKNRSKPLADLKFAVLGLGDTSYPLFCKTGEDIDSMLDGLGASRIQSLGKCDLDIETVANPWIDSLLQNLAQAKSVSSVIATPKVATSKVGSRVIYTGKVETNLVLNDIGATKSTRHIEIYTEEPIDYEPGDSAGFFPKNSLADVETILSLLGIDGEERVTYNGETWMAKDLLFSRVSIRHLPERVVKKYADLIGASISKSKVDLDELLTENPIPKQITVSRLFEILEPMIPRYYSIASSPKSHGENTVHLTVAEVEIETKLGKKEGLCSGFLSHFEIGETVSFYIQKNPNFRLPPDEAPLIMIGPGTGIAPFRSFLFERDANSAAGKNWLFFGERNFVSDFYYQAEFLELMETGILQKLNTAFSRDTKQKVYVQDRMSENADELLKWIEEGAYLYVCGAKDPMSRDVEKCFLEILEKRQFQKEISTDEFLSQLEESGRYKKDVY